MYDSVDFKKEVLEALKNCYGFDYPTDAKSIRVFLEKEWHTLQKMKSINKALIAHAELLEETIVSMAINIYMDGSRVKQFQDYLKNLPI